MNHELHPSVTMFLNRMTTAVASMHQLLTVLHALPTNEQRMLCEILRFQLTGNMAPCSLTLAEFPALHGMSETTFMDCAEELASKGLIDLVDVRKTLKYPNVGQAMRAEFFEVMCAIADVSALLSQPEPPDDSGKDG